ncbi:MAG: acetoacetate metabolism transcriptional regulator AtoC [Candidatus Methylacidiphilales bacterium]
MIVEDEVPLARRIANLLRENGWEVEIFGKLKEAEERLKNSRQPEVDLLLLDYSLPDGTAESLFEICAQLAIPPVSLVITAFPDTERAAAMIRAGLFDYLKKPFQPNQLLEVVRRAAACRNAHKASGIIGGTPVIRRVVQEVALAARHTSVPLLISGETGTGKELLARFYHQAAAGGDEQQAFVDLNCAALPAELIEAELFGAEKGAYTGAQALRRGLVEQAIGGTLFLDEIGELPLIQQAKFLRFLETRQFRRLGGAVSLPFVGRVVAATNRDLSEEVRRGRFRQDLWFRLNVMHVRVPSLRERREDIPMLIEQLLARIRKDVGWSKMPRLPPADVRLLSTYDFPGNIRELRNILERAVMLSPPESEIVRLGAWFPQVLAEQKEDKHRSTPIATWTEAAFTEAPSQQVMNWCLDRLVAAAIRRQEGNLAATCRYLGISREQLMHRLHEMDPELRRQLPRQPRGRPRKQTRHDSQKNFPSLEL